jgi:3-keto-5-aminohexanoate cleavage enzyme
MAQPSRSEEPVIIEVALNGQTMKQVNANSPRTSQEIIASAIASFDAGAAIIHSHIDDIMSPGEKAAALYLEHFLPVLEARPEALIYPTLGMGASVEEKYLHVGLLKKAMNLRIGFVDPGSVNLGGSDADGLPIPIDFAYTNTPAAIRWAFDHCRELEIGPSIAIFEPGFLRHALAYDHAGQLPAGALIKFYLGGDYGYMGAGHKGVSFGLPATPWGLDVYLEMLGDCEIPWSVGVLGGDVFEHGLASHAIERGGHLHVGIEDYMGREQPSNEELVREAARLCDAAGRPVATPAETRKILQLPGSDH